LQYRLHSQMEVEQVWSGACYGTGLGFYLST
jgi:hypothetical protein